MRLTAAIVAAALLSACTVETKQGPVAWEDVTGRPETFPTTWPQVAGRPESFSTTWASIADAPATFPTTWAQVAGRPATFPAAWAELAGVPSTFPTTWAQVEGRPVTFPVDTAVVQARVTGGCSDGAAIAAIGADGAVTCAPRLVTVQLPPATWAGFQCAVISQGFALGGYAVPGIRFQPAGTCTGVRRASTTLTIPHELPAGPRRFRVQAVVTQPLVTGAATLELEWAVPTAGSGAGATACVGSATLSVPALPSVQAMTTLEFDFRADPRLCGGPGSPLVLFFDRTDAGSGELLVGAVHAVFE